MATLLSLNIKEILSQKTCVHQSDGLWLVGASQIFARTAFFDKVLSKVA